MMMREKQHELDNFLLCFAKYIQNSHVHYHTFRFISDREWPCNLTSNENKTLNVSYAAGKVDSNRSHTTKLTMNECISVSSWHLITIALPNNWSVIGQVNEKQVRKAYMCRHSLFTCAVYIFHAQIKWFFLTIKAFTRSNIFLEAFLTPIQSCTPSALHPNCLVFKAYLHLRFGRFRKYIC